MPPSTPPQKINKFFRNTEAKRYLGQLVDQSPFTEAAGLPSNVIKWNSTTGNGPLPAACKGIYTWTSSPRAVYNPRKYLRHYQNTMTGYSLLADQYLEKNEGNGQQPPYQNVMFDKRVIRGSNFTPNLGDVTDGPTAKETEGKRRQLLRKKHQQRTRITDPNEKSTSPPPAPVRGRRNERVQTDKYLEELAINPCELDVACQTDLYLERPTTAPFIPTKYGVDVAVQVDETFDMDRELKALIDECIAQAVVEVAQDQMEAVNDRSQDESSQRNQQQSAQKGKRSSSAAHILQGYIADLLPSILNSIKSIREADNNEELKKQLAPWLAQEVALEVGQIIDSRELLKDLVKEILQERAEVYVAMSGDNRVAADKINLFEDDTFDSEYDGRNKNVEAKFPEKIETVLNRNTIDYETIEKQIQNPIKIQPLGFGSKSSTSDQVTSLESDEVAINEDQSVNLGTEEENNEKSNGTDEVDGVSEGLLEGENSQDLGEQRNESTSSTAADDEPPKFNIEITPKPSAVGETSIDDSDNSNIERESRRGSEEEGRGDGVDSQEERVSIEPKEIKQDEQIESLENLQEDETKFQEIDPSEYQSPEKIEPVEEVKPTSEDSQPEEPIEKELQDQVEKIIFEAVEEVKKTVNEMLETPPTTEKAELQEEEVDKSTLEVIREVDTPNLDSISYPDDDLLENMDEAMEKDSSVREVEIISSEADILIIEPEVKEDDIATMKEQEEKDQTGNTENDNGPREVEEETIVPEKSSLSNQQESHSAQQVNENDVENNSSELDEAAVENPPETPDKLIQDIILETIEQAIITEDNAQPDDHNVAVPINCEDMDLYKDQASELVREENKKQVSFDIIPSDSESLQGMSPNVFKVDEQDNISLLNAFCSDLNATAVSSTTSSKISFDEDERAAVASFVEDIELTAKALVEVPSKLESSIEETVKKGESTILKFKEEQGEIIKDVSESIHKEIVDFVEEIEQKAKDMMEVPVKDEKKEEEKEEVGDKSDTDGLMKDEEIQENREEKRLDNLKESVPKEIVEFVEEIQKEAQIVSQLIKPHIVAQEEKKINSLEESPLAISNVEEIEKSSLQLPNNNDDSEMEMDSLEVYPTGQEEKDEDDTFDEDSIKFTAVTVTENQSKGEDNGKSDSILNNEGSLNKTESTSEPNTEIEAKDTQNKSASDQQDTESRADQPESSIEEKKEDNLQKDELEPNSTIDPNPDNQSKQEEDAEDKDLKPNPIQNTQPREGEEEIITAKDGKL